MWLLHVVVNTGASSCWLTGITLWCVAALVGGSFSCWSGAARNPDVLLQDLLLAATGACGSAALTAPHRTDPVALIGGVPLLLSTVGAVSVLLLGRDVLVRWQQTRRIRFGAEPVAAQVGGLTYLLPRLTGWPAIPGLLEASDAAGRPIKATRAAVHYQNSVGPFRRARAIPLLPGLNDTDQATALALMDRLFAAARIDLQVHDRAVTEFAVQALIDDVAALLQPLLSEQQNALRVDAGPESGSMRGDRFGVQHCLLDVLRCAARQVTATTLVLTGTRVQAADGDAVHFMVTAVPAATNAAAIAPRPLGCQPEAECAPYAGRVVESCGTQELWRRLGGVDSLTRTPAQGVAIELVLPAVVNNAASPAPPAGDRR